MSGNGREREQWGSRIGFVLAAAGSAVGLGNIWKFPFIAGMNGGGAFVLFYIISILIIGLPVMLIEFSIGRRTQLSPVGAYKSLAPKGPYFIIGIIGVGAGFIILSYYSVVAGWTLGYIIKAISGSFSSFADSATALKVVEEQIAGILDVSPEAIPWAILPDSLSNWKELYFSLSEGAAVPDTIISKAASKEFGGFVSNPIIPIISHACFLTLCVLVVFRGIKGGIEKWNRFLMPTLFIILLLLVARGLTLEGSEKGLAFLFAPDFSKLTGPVMLTALGHAFFTLSLGMGAMLTYGSYLKRKEDLIRSALWILFADTIVALLAGIAIFTTVFAMGFAPDGGPGLVFQVLPGIFALMPGGWAVGILFFLLLSIAAVTSGVSLLEVVTTYFIDQKGWSRSNATVFFAFIIFLLGVPSALSFSMLSDFTIFGMTFFDFFDYLSFKYMLPLGGFFMTLFVIFKWGVPNMIKELQVGNPKFNIPVALATIILIVAATFIGITFVFELIG